MTDISAEKINHQQNWQKPGKGEIIGGIVVGATANQSAKMFSTLVSPKIIKKMSKISNSLSKDEYSSVEQAVKKTLESSKLAEKGVGIIKAIPDNIDDITNIMLKEFDNNLITKFLPKSIKESLGIATFFTAEQGKNAFYTFKSKKIILPDNKLILSAFHEMGHAANQNLSKIGKILQKTRSINLLAIPIAMIALFKTKKAPGEKSKSKGDKITTFIKNNAGKLTFLTFIPILLEEGLASIKGNAFAKKVLNPELAKKVLKTNAFAFSSYLILAAASSLGIYLGAKIKDSIAAPEPIKKM